MKKIIILTFFTAFVSICALNASVEFGAVLNDIPITKGFTKGHSDIFKPLEPKPFLALDVFEHNCLNTGKAEVDLEYFSDDAIASLRNLKVCVNLIWNGPNLSSGILVQNKTKGNFAFKQESIERLFDTGLHPVWLRVGQGKNVPCKTVDSFFKSLPKRRKWTAFLSPYSQ